MDEYEIPERIKRDKKIRKKKILDFMILILTPKYGRKINYFYLSF